MSEWTYDPVASAQYARTHEPLYNSERKYRHPPHHLRCDFMKDGVRCVKGSGHEHGVGAAREHEEPKA